MARLTFPAATGDPNVRYRFDTEAGSASAASIVTLRSATEIDGAVLRADTNGALPAFRGPDGVDLLYRKKLSYADTVLETATVRSDQDPAGIDLGAVVGGLGDAATKNVGTSAGTVAAGNDSRITGAAQKSANLSDLGSAATSRTNLGAEAAGAAAAVAATLGTSAARNVGTSTGQVAAGDDSRITGAAQKSANLSDIASAATGRTNLGLAAGATAEIGTGAGTVAAGDDSRIVGAAQKAEETRVRLTDQTLAAGFGNNNTAVAAAITAANSGTTDYGANVRPVDLQGRTALITGVTLQAYTGLKNGNIFRASGATGGLITCPSQASFQSTQKSILENLVITGQGQTVGNIGVDILNHAALTLRDVRVGAEGVGVRIRGGQFNDFYSLKAVNCRVGLDVANISVTGGGNSNYFASYHATNCEVGALFVNEVPAFPLHSIEMVSPQLLGNSMCALAAIDVTDLSVRGWAAEANGSSGSATGSYNGHTVKRSSVYMSGSRALFDGGMIAEASVNPCFVLENGSHLTLRDMIGYGLTSGVLVAADATSSVNLQGRYGCIGVVHGAEVINIDLVSTQGLILGPPRTRDASDVPNALTSPQAPGFSDTNGAASSTTGTDTTYGPYDQVTYTASGSPGRIRRNFTLAGATLIGVTVQASVDTDLVLGLNPNQGNKTVSLRAGEWKRIYWWNNTSLTGSQDLIVTPNDAVGATVKFCKWQVVTGTDGPALRANWSAVTGGAYNAGNPAARVTESVNTVAASSTTQTLPDPATATIHRITLTGNCTFTFPTAVAGASFAVVLVQDATGSRTATWPGSVVWVGTSGVAPTLATASGKRDVLTFLCTDGSTWLGTHAGAS